MLGILEKEDFLQIMALYPELREAMISKVYAYPDNLHRKIRSRLRGLPICRGMEHDQIYKLASCFKIVKYKEGATVIKYG